MACTYAVSLPILVGIVLLPLTTFLFWHSPKAVRGEFLLFSAAPFAILATAYLLLQAPERAVFYLAGAITISLAVGYWYRGTFMVIAARPDALAQVEYEFSTALAAMGGEGVSLGKTWVREGTFIPFVLRLVGAPHSTTKLPLVIAFSPSVHNPAVRWTAILLVFLALAAVIFGLALPAPCA